MLKRTMNTVFLTILDGETENVSTKDEYRIRDLN